MKRIYLVLLVTGIALGIAFGAETSTGVRDISGLLEKARAKQNLPAVAAMVIHGDAITAQGVAGVRKLGGGEPVQLNDRWHLGSCTKAFTATMIAILVEKGKLSCKTTIVEALPDMKEKMKPQYRDVTLEMLLANRGGIGHEWDVPGLWDILWKREGTPVEERRKMAEAMLAQPPKVKPGQYFYSNCGYSIAGHMAEKIMKKPWEQLVEELIFKPLGMKTAGFGVPWTEKPPTDPWPHNQDGTFVTPGPFADNPPAIGPAGTIHASIGDWAKFIMEHLKGSQGKDGQLLKASSYQRLHKGQRIGVSNQAYALGWMVFNRPWAKGTKSGDTGRCLQHAGSNNSWFSVVWIVPELNFAVIGATNIGGQGIYPRFDLVIWEVIQESGFVFVPPG